jgi:TrpR family trp operon transcriptional repressor
MHTKKEGWLPFINLCSQAASDQELERIFEIFFTYDEQDQLADRIVLLKELLGGKKTQREIAADHHISIAKITRGANLLKGMDQEMVDYLKEKL